jgi:hypothetical protein
MGRLEAVVFEMIPIFILQVAKLNFIASVLQRK